MEIKIVPLMNSNINKIIQILCFEESSMKSTLLGRVLTLKESINFIKENFSFNDDEREKFRVVLVNNEVIGFTGATKFNYKDDIDEFQGHEIGCLITKSFWGKGIATSISILLLEEFKGNKIYATVHPSNLASIKVLNKTGFELVKKIYYPERGERFLMLHQSE